MDSGPEVETRPEPGEFASAGALTESQADVASADAEAASAERIYELVGQPATRWGASEDKATGRARRLLSALAARTAPLRLVVGVYASTRLLLLVVAIVSGHLQHWRLSWELSNWDGVWYLPLAAHGYPTHVSQAQTTLGFFPLYPIVIWPVAHLFFISYLAAGLLVAGIGGLVATVLVQRLCSSWWGEAAGRRAAVAFCLFPGSIVFSMDYSEGLLLSLVCGCLLALAGKRWLLAGLLAALTTAVGPDGLAIVAACAVAAFLELRRRGFADRSARRSLVAPLLAPAGIVGVGAFLWAWTGTPFATFEAQRDGWGERTDPLALYHQARTVARELSHSPFSYHRVNLNYVAGLLGAVLLVVALVLLARARDKIAPEALAWTLGIAFLCCTSEYTPPNPRLLITAFPVVAVFAYRLGRKGFRRFAVVNGLLLVVMSSVTYVGIALRP